MKLELRKYLHLQIPDFVVVKTDAFLGAIEERLLQDLHQHCVAIINDYPFQKVTFESLKGDIGVLSSIPLGAI